mmetsp:Transcript_71669/g.226463  ORF Transcript_71669/g.226463 Transcript_71669/m.226463 type:complete len:227 (+) Transcript_71669:2152-2832(+)
MTRTFRSRRSPGISGRTACPSASLRPGPASMARFQRAPTRCALAKATSAGAGGSWPSPSSRLTMPARASGKSLRSQSHSLAAGLALKERKRLKMAAASFDSGPPLAAASSQTTGVSVAQLATVSSWKCPTCSSITRPWIWTSPVSSSTCPASGRIASTQRASAATASSFDRCHKAVTKRSRVTSSSSDSSPSSPSPATSRRPGNTSSASGCRHSSFIARFQTVPIA